MEWKEDNKKKTVATAARTKRKNEVKCPRGTKLTAMMVCVCALRFYIQHYTHNAFFYSLSVAHAFECFNNLLSTLVLPLMLLLLLLLSLRIYLCFHFAFVPIVLWKIVRVYINKELFKCLQFLWLATVRHFFLSFFFLLHQCLCECRLFFLFLLVVSFFCSCLLLLLLYVNGAVVYYKGS